MKTTSIPLLLAALAASSVARAQTPPPPVALPLSSSALPAEPSTGTALLAVGGVSLSLGIVALATVAPVCATAVQGQHFEFVPMTAEVPGDRKPCLEGAIGAGVGLVVVALPLLIVGGVKRSTWNHWREQGPVLAPTAGGATLTWQGRF